MAQAIDSIQSCTVGMDAASFKADRKTQDAVIRNLESIGEACNIGVAILFPFGFQGGWWLNSVLHPL